MEGPKRIKQLYGYTVCLVVIITFLFSVFALIEAMFNLSDPLHVENSMYGQANLASFETYKMDILRSPQHGQEPSTPGYVPDDETLRAMYEASRDDRIQSVRFRARRSLITNGLLIIGCILLFATHWVWMRKLDRVEA